MTPFFSHNMSPVVLLIFLVLSRSIHACNARIIKMEVTKSSNAVFDVSSKGFGVAKLNETSLDPVVMQGMVPADTIHGGASAADGKLMSSQDSGQGKRSSTARVLSAAAAKKPSLVKVSNWRGVPRDEAMEDPRFDVDYVGPTTHTPTHN